MSVDESVEEFEDEQAAELTELEANATTTERPEGTQGYRRRRGSAKTNRSRALYIRKSITRLSVISDRPLNTKADICAALEDYGHCLPPEQRAALEKWCDIS